MKVLMLESYRGMGNRATGLLEAAGHMVVRCESDAGAPCVGLELDGACPLDADDVSVAVVATTGGELQPGEHGALCASRRRIPVLTAATVTEPGPLSSVSRPAGDDLVAAVEAAARDGSAHADAVRRALVELGVVAPDDVVGDEPAVGIEVERDPRRLALTLHLADGDPRTGSIVKAAAEALRRFDPHVAVIDTTVRT